MIKVSNKHFTKVICEIGINHNGSIKDCEELIRQAHDTKSWGIKFQYRNLKNYFKNYKNSTELGKEIIDKEIKRNYLSPKKIKLLSNYAKKLGLKTGISFFVTEDILQFKKIKFDTSKYIGAKSKILCVKKITKIIKNYPKHLVNIKLGIKETIDWFIRTNKI